MIPLWPLGCGGLLLLWLLWVGAWFCLLLIYGWVAWRREHQTIRQQHSWHKRAKADISWLESVTETLNPFKKHNGNNNKGHHKPGQEG